MSHLNEMDHKFGGKVLYQAQVAGQELGERCVVHRGAGEWREM